MKQESNILINTLYLVGKGLTKAWANLTQWVEVHTAEAGLILGGLILGIGSIAHWLIKRREKKKGLIEAQRETIAADSPQPSSEMSFFMAGSANIVKSKEPVIRERTREDISTMFNTLKSIPRDPKTDLPQIEMVDPQFLSELVIEDTKDGQFSKLTMAAVLLFDKSDMKENLDDWAQKTNAGDKEK